MTTKPNRVKAAILETAQDLRRLGIMDETTFEKIAARNRDQETQAGPAPISGDEIRSLREKANVSQAVFAQALGITVGYVSQLERGAKHPRGPALVLLDLMRRKGVEVIF